MVTPATQAMVAGDAALAGFARQYPLGGLGTVDDTAQAIAWLLSPAAARITGQVLAVDGGFAAVRPMVR
jgi:NAD(P)-dependent dehydrogenase (short-subunit alcohol dehydrogenase family)